MLSPRLATFALSTPLVIAAAVGCNRQTPESVPAQPTEPSAVRTAAGAVASAPTTTVDAGANEDAATADAGTGTGTGTGTGKSVQDVALKVKVVSIGMHVGGGPFDEVTKQPFLRSVEPHYPELARCFALVAKPKQGDVGVDLHVRAAGGRAKVTNPRSTLSGEGFTACVVAFFEKIEFEKSPHGNKVVSYSVRFTPVP